MSIQHNYQCHKQKNGGENINKNVIFLLLILLSLIASMSMVVAAESNFNLENDTNLDSAIDISVDSDIDSNINSNIISDLNSSSTSNDNPKSANSTVANGQNSSTTPPNTIVSGKILNCDNDDPFKGATIYIKTLNGEILATTVSDGNGNYLASFYSLDTQFYVLATYPGHVYPSETINVIQYEGMNYGVANMRFGNLSLAILSSPTLVYGSNLTAGPNSTVVEIAITNNAATTATNVWANFTSSGLGANFILAPGQSSSQFLGNITPGQTVYAFFLVTLINPGTFTLNYTVSVSGDNTGSPIDTINGSITSASGISQNRNAINSITVSNTNPNVGDFITITVVSSTANSNFAWVNLPVWYDPSVLNLINISTTMGNGVTVPNIFLNATGQTSFVTTWVFQVTGTGNTVIVPYIIDSSGGSIHYNSKGQNLGFTATPSADLAITKTANTTNPVVGDTVTFTLTVRNNGPNNATGVNVTDVLDTTMMQFVSSSASVGAYSNNTGIWTIGNLNVNATVTLTITVTIIASGQIVNVANVSGNENDPNLINNYASVILSANQTMADLAVSKSVDSASPVNGGTVVFTIVVINNGPNTAVNSRLTDVLPNGLILLGSNPSQGTYNPSTGLWSIGNLTSGSMVTLTLTCKVNGTGNMTNTATVTSDTSDPILSNNNASVTINSQPSADLGVLKTVDNPNAIVGQNVTFTIAVTNYGPDNATGVYVSDSISVPLNLQYINSSTDTGFITESVLPRGHINGFIWQIGDLAVGQTVYLNITFIVTASGLVSNTAFVGGEQFDPNPSNDISTATISGDPNADLAITKTADKTTYNNGDTVTYTIVVTNYGPSTAINATVTDMFPSSLTYLSSNPSQGSYDPSTGVWTIGDLPNTDTVTLIITAKINQAGTISNIVVVQSNTTDYNPSNNLDASTIQANPSTDLKVVKNANATNVTVGSTVNFTIVIYNLGPDTATGVTLVDYLPAGLVWVSDTSGGAYNPATGMWTIGTMAPGGFVTLNIVCMVNSTISIMNTAMVYGNEYDPDLSNNHDNVFINGIPVADLSVVKSADKTVYNNGDIITYTITVTNNGPNVAANTIATDLIPTGVIFVSAIVPGGTSYNSTTGIWNIGTLNPFVQATLVITVRANQTGLITNYVNVSSDTYDPITSNNQNSVTVTVNPTVDLAITKTASASTANVGDYINFTITVTNNGPDNATGVYVIEPLPIGMRWYGDNSSSAYDHIGGIWNIGNLAVGQTVSLQITVRIMSSSLTMNNTVRVGSIEYDSNPSNNVATVIVTSNASADLAITKTVDNSSPNNGATITFTIIVSNNGPDNSTGVVVGDLLPNGLVYVNSNPSTGTYNSTDGIWTIGNLTVGSSVTLTITANVNTTGNITNVAQVGSDTYDPNMSNNIANVTINAQKAADLSVIKTVDNSTPEHETLVTFTITVTNNGPDNATNVTVFDLLPIGLTYVSSSNNASSGNQYDPITGILYIGDLAVGDSVTLNITVNVTSLGNYINNVTVNATENDPNPTNNNGSARLNGTPIANLAIHKVISNPTPSNGDTVTFYIFVTNNGPDTATSVTINETLDNRLTILNISASPGNYVPSTGIWTIGDLANGQTAILSITVLINESGEYNNTINVNSTTPPGPNPPDNNITIQFNVTKTVDINVVKTVSASKVKIGDIITFTITVTNNGPDNATNVNLTDLLPTGLNYLSSNNNASSGNQYDNITGFWNIGNLTVGETVELNITVNVTVSNTIITNIANASASENESNYANNLGVAVVTVEPLPSELPADVAIIKSVDNQNPYVGEKVNFTITVTNRGPNEAINVTATDKLPDGMLYVSDNSGGTYNPLTGNWTIGNLTVGQTVTLVIEVIVTKAGVLDNHASVTAVTPDPILGNNNNSISINVLPKADVGVVKTVDNNSPSQGDIVKFTITVTNYGVSAAENVLVTDHIPNGLKYLRYTTSQGNYVSASGHWFIGHLAVNQSVTLEVWVEVTAEDSTIINEATKTQSTLDTDIRNDHDSATLRITPHTPKLEVTKTANATVVSVGDLIKYTITIKNVGGKVAIGVYALDKLPSSLQFISASASIGSYNPRTGKWTVGDLAPGETATLTIVARALKAGKIVNRVEVGYEGGSEHVVSEFNVTVKPKGSGPDNNDTNHTNGTDNNPSGTSGIGMKNTGNNVIAIVLILLNLVTIVIGKIKLK